MKHIERTSYLEKLKKLNIIIKPDYNDVAPFANDSEDLFYVVENKISEFAAVDHTGTWKTDFEKSSVYDMQTQYFQNYVH